MSVSRCGVGTTPAQTEPGPAVPGRPKLLPGAAALRSRAALRSPAAMEPAAFSQRLPVAGGPANSGVGSGGGEPAATAGAGYFRPAQ